MTNNKHTCGQDCEVWSRVCGYYRPTNRWNKGKQEEFKERKPFELKNVNRYYDPQIGVEYTTADIVTTEINSNANNQHTTAD